MKRLFYLFLATLSLSGCYSYVRTYDGKGRMLAECRSGNEFIGSIPVPGWSFVVPCSASANPRDITENRVEPADLEANATSYPNMGCPKGTEWKYNECYPSKLIKK